MNKIIFSFLVCFIASTSFAQQETFDITTYTPLKGWEKKLDENTVQFVKQDTVKGTYCVITLYKAVPATADSKKNFDASWETLVKETLDITAAPAMQPASKEGDLEVQNGYAAFEKDGTNGIALLVSTTGFATVVNILILTNTDTYETDISSFLESVQFNKPSQPKEPAVGTTTQTTAQPAGKSAFKFTSTNFDDGWIATEQADWVEVTKDNIKILLHYPKEGTIIPADPEPFINNAWNILVAPRYRDLKNYIVARTITEYERGYLAAGTATDIKTGKEVFVTLFRRGSSGFIEFITPDKKTFVDKFGVDLTTITWSSDSKIWDPLQKMANYNRFAVAAADLTGVWTSDFSGMQQLYHVYTGQYAGMNIHQSSETFEFGGGNSYSWKILAVNGMVGSMKFDQAKSAGKFSVPNNWQVYFSMLEGKPKTFNAYFSCIKGARILWLQDAAYPTNYTGYGKK